MIKVCCELRLWFSACLPMHLRSSATFAPGQPHALRLQRDSCFCYFFCSLAMKNMRRKNILYFLSDKYQCREIHSGESSVCSRKLPANCCSWSLRALATLNISPSPFSLCSSEMCSCCRLNYVADNNIVVRLYIYICRKITSNNGKQSQFVRYS